MTYQREKIINNALLKGNIWQGFSTVCTTKIHLKTNLFNRIVHVFIECFRVSVGVKYICTVKEKSVHPWVVSF